MAKDTVILGYVYGQIHPRFHHNIMSIMMYEMSRGSEAQLVDVISHQGCYVTKNRNEVCSGFIKSSYNPDWLLFLDTDIVTRTDCIERLTKMANETPTDILALPYPLLDGSVSLYREDPAEKGVYRSLCNLKGDYIYELDAAGTGHLLIHRRVLVKLRDEYPEPWHWFDHDQVGFNKIGDDLTFCRRAKKHGFKIHGWTGWMPEHWKSHPVKVPVEMLDEDDGDS